MKFIYCMNTNLTEDLEKVGLQKLGTVNINGEEISVFANNKNTFLNIYQKNEILLSNKLFFNMEKEE